MRKLNLFLQHWPGVVEQNGLLCEERPVSNGRVWRKFWQDIRRPDVSWLDVCRPGVCQGLKSAGLLSLSLMSLGLKFLNLMSVVHLSLGLMSSPVLGLPRAKWSHPVPGGFQAGGGWRSGCPQDGGGWRYLWGNWHHS